MLCADVGDLYGACPGHCVTPNFSPADSIVRCLRQLLRVRDSSSSFLPSARRLWASGLWCTGRPPPPPPPLLQRPISTSTSSLCVRFVCLPRARCSLGRSLSKHVSWFSSRPIWKTWNKSRSCEKERMEKKENPSRQNLAQDLSMCFVLMSPSRPWVFDPFEAREVSSFALFEDTKSQSRTL